MIIPFIKLYFLYSYIFLFLYFSLFQIFVLILIFNYLKIHQILQTVMHLTTGCNLILSCTQKYHGINNKSKIDLIIKLKFQIKPFYNKKGKKHYSINNILLMLPSSEDKKMLIQSMKKLTHHISNNQIRQKQIFDSLTKNDLLKIISNLSDDNQYLRRISGLLLAELFYNNDQIKQKAIKLLEIFPIQGRICLNQIPYRILSFPSTFKKCIQLMKSPVKQDQSDKFCWIINLDRKNLQIQFLQYKKYSSFTFLDPSRNIFGFTFISKNKKQIINRQINNSKSKQKSVKSIDSRASSKRQNLGINSSFYKNYLQARNRKAQSPSSYRDYYQKKDFNRPNTSRNHKNDYMGSNIKSSGNTIQNISQYAKYNKQTSIYDKIGTPVRKDRNQNKMAINTLHQSLNFSPTTIRSPIGSAHREDSLGFRAPQTDRKHDTSYRFKLNQSQIMSSSIGQKSKFPQTTKNSYINQHQKFYKRVKQILKR